VYGANFPDTWRGPGGGITLGERIAEKRDASVRWDSVTVRAGVLVAGRYRVAEQAGSGGMGAVWRAWDVREERDVALKRAHPGSDERALREARTAGLVDHPRVVGLYDVVVEEGVRWLVMEYVPGRDLARILDSDGVLPAARAAQIGWQLAEALEAIHACGFVHGDVAPANVLVTADGDAKLTDFGAARAIWSDATVTDGGTAPGTPPYLAPEVARGEDKIPASDVFSLGATLFAAVEGVSPLGDGANALAFTWRSGSGHISAPSVPGPLGPALAAFLHPEPERRPDAAEAKALLRAASDEGAHPPAGGRRPGRRGRWVAAGAGGLAVLAAAGLAAVLAQRGDPGTAVRPEAAAKAAAAPAAVGDQRTADPCALLDPAGFRPYGPSALSADYGNFDRCDVLVQHGQDDLADVEIELDQGPWPEPGPRDQRIRRGPVTILRVAQDDPEECDQALLLPGKNVAYVTAQRTGPGKIDLCRAATTASAQAARVLARGPVPRRTAPFPARSLARADACALLKAKGEERGFGGWRCDGHSGGRSVRLLFDRDSPLSAGEDGRPARFAGHRAYVQPRGDGDTTCVARIVHRAYTNADGDARQEIAMLVVEGDAPMARLCGDVRRLAKTTAARMPRG